MKKTVYWNETLIKNMSAEVNIPNWVATKGDKAILEWLEHHKERITPMGTCDDIEYVDDFDNLHVSDD